MLPQMTSEVKWNLMDLDERAETFSESHGP